MGSDVGAGAQFIDTNVFLRFLTNDDPVKANRAESLFKRVVLGKVQARTSLLVIAEIVWTLESFYGLRKAEVADKVRTVLNTPNLKCPEAILIRQALDLYAAQNIDFVDAYHAFYLKDEGIHELFTYDRKHFGRIDWIEIVEP